MNDPRLEQLLDHYVDGALSDADRAELERSLLTSPAAREAFWAHARLHARLSRWGQESWGARMAAEPSSIDTANALSQESITLAPVARRWRRRAATLVAIVALVLIGLLLIPWLRHDAGDVQPTPENQVEAPATLPAGIAILSSAVDAVWDGPSPVAVGSLLPPGTVLKLSAGAARVELFSGARLVLQGPVEVALRSEMSVDCRLGKITAQVPTPARGFTVLVAGMSVVDLGTEFAVDVPADRPPEVHVFTGTVQLMREHGQGAASRPDIRPAATLVKGQAVRVIAGGSRLETIAATPSAFLREQDIVRLADGDVEQRKLAWRAASARLLKDPAAIAYFTFPVDVATTRTVVNAVSTASPQASVASIVGCTVAEGRWAGVPAIDFQGAGDRVRLNVPGAFESISLLAWVRLDQLPGQQSSLLMSDSLVEGALRWSISEHGELRFGIARQSGKPTPNWEVVISQPALAPDRLGRWVLLGSTFDGQRVRHYVDGELVGSGAAFSPVPLELGLSEIGNWRGPDLRSLRGRLDEFAILSRALTREEVRAFFEAGRPQPGW